MIDEKFDKEWKKKRKEWKKNIDDMINNKKEFKSGDNIPYGIMKKEFKSGDNIPYGMIKMKFVSSDNIPYGITEIINELEEIKNQNKEIIRLLIEIKEKVKII